MILMKLLYVLVYISSKPFYIEAKPNISDINIEEIANSLFSTLLRTNFVNSTEVPNELLVHNDIKMIVDRKVNILNTLADSLDVRIATDIINNEMVDAVNDILNITLNLSINNIIDRYFHNHTIVKSLNTNSQIGLILKYNMSSLRNANKPSRRHYVRNRRSSQKVENTNKFKLQEWNEHEPTRRVYQGRQTNIVHYPFMVSVHENDQFVCSGCIIRRDLVISSASCFQKVYQHRDKDSPSIKLRVGSDYVHKGGYIVAANHAIFHPSYDPVSLRNNLVLLSVSDNAFMKPNYEWIKRVKYTQRNVTVTVNETISKVRILGWGEQNGGDDENSHEEEIDAGNQTAGRGTYETRLSYDTLDIYKSEECMAIYSRYYVTKNNICAGFLLEGNGVCKYDVGGPGLYNGLLVGIISFGPARCGTRDKPTVFTKLRPYVAWIHEIAHQVIPRLKKKLELAKTRKQSSLLKQNYKDLGSKSFSTENTGHYKATNDKNLNKKYEKLQQIVDEMPLTQSSDDDSVAMSLEAPSSLNTTAKSYWLDYIPIASTKSIIRPKRNSTKHKAIIRSSQSNEKTDLADAVLFEKFIKSLDGN